MNFFQNINRVFGEIIVHSTARQQYYKNGSRQLTMVKHLDHYYQTSQKLLTLSHELLIGKQNAYGFSLKVSKLTKKYLSQSIQRTKINGYYSSRDQILFGGAQESVFF